MKLKGKTMKQYLLALTLAAAVGCQGSGKIELKTEVLGTSGENGPLPLPGAPGTPSGPPGTFNGLFSGEPGKAVSFKSLGAVDATGTSIVDDFDGDGKLNNEEATTSPWIGDYARIESSVAPRIEMKILVQKSGSTTVDEIGSEISSEDKDDTITSGSEKVHQAEVNERTVQFQDQVQKSTGSNSSVGVSLSYEEAVPFSKDPASAKDSYGSSEEYKDGYSATTTKWKDVPFKNNLGRDGFSQKNDLIDRSTAKFRKEKRALGSAVEEIKPDAGIIRASLFIKNHSVNLPVRLSNIICTLMFQTPKGDLIPMQTFRLRHDDYSLFEVNTYGGNSFGPYTVTLSGLNTAEVEDAIRMGYVPQIHIVDYQMTHVPDSNYRAMLKYYNGDNVKIIEENIKGRSAMVRIIGPDIREIYRVAAFTTSNQDPTDPCKANPADVNTTATPGISLEKLLERISCTGTKIEFGDYVYDIKEIFPEAPHYIYRAVKSVETKPGVTVASKMKCRSDVSDVCYMEQRSKWSKDDLAAFGYWVVYVNGKYYDRDEPDSPAMRTLTNVAEQVPVRMGIKSRIWAGDTIDLVYIRTADIVAFKDAANLQPLDYNMAFKMNTKWDLGSVGNDPFGAKTNSFYLGKAGLGDTIEFTFALKDTTLLNPSFGTNIGTGEYREYNQFSYAKMTYTPLATMTSIRKLFSLEEAVDFEISFDLGNKEGHWHNLRTLDTDFSYTSSYSKQVFSARVKIPDELTNSPRDGLVDVYIRPGLNNAYRNSFWPKGNSEQTGISLQIPNNFENDFNSAYGPLKLATSTSGDNCSASSYLSSRCMGFNASVDIANWLGGFSFGNFWADATKLETLASSADGHIVRSTPSNGLYMSLTGNFANPENFFRAPLIERNYEISGQILK